MKRPGLDIADRAARRLFQAAWKGFAVVAVLVCLTAVTLWVVSYRGEHRAWVDHTEDGRLWTRRLTLKHGRVEYWGKAIELDPGSTIQAAFLANPTMAVVKYQVVPLTGGDDWGLGFRRTRFDQPPRAHIRGVQAMGVEVEQQEIRGPDESGVIVKVPLYLVTLASATVPAITGLGWLRRRRVARRRSGGLCVGCGYDLRGSPVGGRCPECGRDPAPPMPAAAGVGAAGGEHAPAGAGGR